MVPKDNAASFQFDSHPKPFVYHDALVHLEIYLQPTRALCSHIRFSHNDNFPQYLHLLHVDSGVQWFITQEEAGGGEGRGDRLTRHAGGGESGGAEEGDVRAASATGQGAVSSYAVGGAGEARGGASVVGSS